MGVMALNDFQITTYDRIRVARELARGFDAQTAGQARAATREARASVRSTNRYNPRPMTAPVIPVALEYASTITADRLDPRIRAAAGSMLCTAIASGLCVAVCFGSLANAKMFWWVHLGVFGATLAFAVRGGLRLRDLNDRYQIALDFVASLGLVGIAIAPLFMAFGNRSHQDGQIALLGICYLLMAATTARHRMLYRTLGVQVRIAGHVRVARFLVTVGWIKAIYEGLWLACCGLTLIAFAARDTEGAGFLLAFVSLFGVFGFAGVWVLMIIVHAQLFAISRK